MRRTSLSVGRLVRYFILPLYRPQRGLGDLLQEPRRVAYGLLIYLFLGIIYTVSVQMAWARGFGAGVTPFLAIPADRYYSWQRFFQIPFFLVAFITFAGTARLVAAAFRGGGSFENAFALCAVAMTLPMMLTMWVPETIIFFAAPPGYAPSGAWGTVWLLFNIVRQVAGVLWPLVLIGLGLARSERIGGFAAAAATTVAFLPTGALMVIFIR
jgi:hypothetical protein